VAWVLLEFADGKSQHAPAQPLQKRPKLYVDETIEPEVLERLRKAKANFVVGRPGLSDECHAQEATRQKRFILTNDRDFLSNRKFPHESFYGAIVLEGDLGDAEAYREAIENLVSLAKHNRGDFEGTKFEVSASTITAHFAPGEKMQLRVRERKLYEWVEE